MDGRASALAEAEAMRDVVLLDEEFARLSAVSSSEVRAAAARYLRADAVGAVVYLPEGRGADLDAASLAAAFAPPATPRAAGGTMPPLRVPPVNGRPAGRTESGVLHVPLDGVDLLVRRKSGVPAVTLGAYVARTEPEAATEAGIGALALRSAIRGAGEFDAETLALAFERLGGSLGASAATDWVGLGTSVMTEQLAPAASLLRLALEQPRFDDAELTLERDLMIEEARQVADDTFRFPFQLAFRGAFGDRGYGLPTTGLEETLATLTPARTAAWHRAQVLGRRLTVVAVGELDPERAADELAAIFRDWQGGAVAPPMPERWQPAGAPVERIVELGKAQSAFAMLFPGPARRDAARHAAEVWAAVASGLGGRLFDALRERRSLAYTVLAFSWQRGRAGALGTYIATSPEREGEARQAMLDELERFATEPVSEAELRGAIGYLAGQAVVQRQSAGHVAAEVLEDWMIGGGLAELDDPAAPFRRVSAEDVWRVGRESLRPEQRAEGVVRGIGGGR